MRLILVRHGQTDWNRDYRVQGQADPPLNETGRAQAETIAGALKGEPIEAIYSSPLLRAIDTARTINRFHGVPLIEHPALKELDTGEADGIYFPHLAERYPDFFRQWKADAASVRWPGGESMEELQARAWKVIEGITTGPPRGCIVITSHLFVLLGILCKALDLRLSNYRRLNLSIGAISEIEAADGRWRLLRFNETCHLEPGSESR